MKQVGLSILLAVLVVFPSSVLADPPTVNIPPTNAYEKIITSNGSITAPNFIGAVHYVGQGHISITSSNGSQTVYFNGAPITPVGDRFGWYASNTIGNGGTKDLHLYNFSTGHGISATVGPDDFILSAVNFVNASSKSCGANAFFDSFDNTTGIFVCKAVNGTGTLDTIQNLTPAQAYIYKSNNTNTNFQFRGVNVTGSLSISNSSNLVTIHGNQYQNNTGLNIGKGGKGVYAGNNGPIFDFKNITSIRPSLFTVSSNGTDVTLDSIFKSNTFTCPGNSKVSAFDNSTGIYTCSGGSGERFTTFQNIGKGGAGVLTSTGTILQGKNITSTNSNLLTVVSNSTDVNLTPKVNYNDVIPASYINSINKTTGSYQGINATTQKIIYTGSDIGLITNKEIHDLATNGGKIFFKAGNYTATTHILINQSQIMLQGEGWANGPSPRSTIIQFNTGSLNSGLSINATSISSSIKGIIIQDMTLMRFGNNTARNIVQFGPNPTFHIIFERVTVYEPNNPKWADMFIQGTDVVHFLDCDFLRLGGLKGTESEPELIRSTGNLQDWYTTTHVGTAGGLASPPDGLASSLDRQGTIGQTTFDSLRNPFTSSNSDWGFSNAGFFNNVNNKVTATGTGVISGIQHNYGISGSKNFTAQESNIRLDTTNSFVDNSDIKKQAKFDASGLSTNHTQTYILPNKNGTFALTTDLTNTAQGNNLTSTNGAGFGIFEGRANATQLNFRTVASNPTLTVSTNATNMLFNDTGTSPDANFYHRLRGQSWYSAANYGNTVTGTAVPSFSNTTVAYPFLVGHGFAIDRIEFDVSTNVAGRCIVGVYSDNGTVYPGSLLVSGSVQQTGTTGVKSDVIATNLQNDKLYWMVWNCSNVSPTLRSISSANLPQVLGYTGVTGAGQNLIGYRAASNLPSVGYSLPSTFSTTATDTTNSAMPLILVRAK